jgi:multicomponent Na+:H+ antiporter subunit C
MSLLFSEPFAPLGAVLVAIGLAGLLAGPDLLRRLIGFNLAGSGLFLLFGALSGRMRGEPLPTGPDPVPQAMIITGIVVALAATALGVALARRLADGERDDG